MAVAMAEKNDFGSGHFFLLSQIVAWESTNIQAEID